MGTRRHPHYLIPALISDARGRRPAGRGALTGLRLVAVACAASACASPAGEVALDSVESLPAVYTTEQADRGERVFSTVCSTCHGSTEFTGPIFAATWMAEPVGNLYQHVSVAMPQDRPGTLAPEEYADVLAYFLRLNGRPAGGRELPADVETLARMRW